MNLFEENSKTTPNNASYFMANFGLTFTFIVSNQNYCGQKGLSSKSATKVYATRFAKCRIKQ